MAPNKLESEIDRLYALPLDDFTAARDELARRLRSDGDRDGAAEVKALRKPNLPAWALNQVRHRDPATVKELLAAGTRLQEAQAQLVAGGEPGLLRDAAAAERRLVDEVVALGETELTQSGHTAGATLQTKLRATAHAAALSPEAGELLEVGRLVRDYEVSDLGLMGTGAALAPRETPKRKERVEQPAEPRPTGRKAAARGADTRGADKRAVDHPGADKRDSDKVDKREAAKREAAERKAIERQVRIVQRELDRARANRTRLSEKLGDAQRRATDARRQAAKATAELERAEASLEQADERAGAAAQRVSELEASLQELRR
jgi:hypothetical protein